MTVPGLPDSGVQLPHGIGHQTLPFVEGWGSQSEIMKLYDEDLRTRESMIVAPLSSPERDGITRLFVCNLGTPCTTSVSGESSP